MAETSSNKNKGVDFLQWALPQMGYRWDGFSKPRAQVLKRIRERMAELELSGGYEEYKDYLRDHPEEWKNLDALCDVTISKFFRDRKLWDYLRDKILRKLISDEIGRSVSKTEVLDFWSAGCCNGEEPYSLAIIYHQLKNSKEAFKDRPVSILASDRNEEVLQRAKKGCYPAGALKELKDEEVSTFFRRKECEKNSSSKKGEDYENGCYEIEEKLRENISFEKRDIRNSIPKRNFHLVLCRNLVFTYFTVERQQYFLQRLKPHLRQDGYLVIGSNEQIPEIDWLEPVSDTYSVFKRVV